MTSLYFYILLLMLLASLFVLLPVWRYRGQQKTEQSELRKQQNIEVFKQSLQELDENRSNGLVEAEEYDTLKLELERNFLSDLEDHAAGSRSAYATHTRLVPILLMLIIPIGGFLLYREVGAGHELVIPELLDQIGAVTTEAEQLEILQEITVVLNQSFERDNDDIQTGYTLGTLYISLEQFTDAVRVFSTLAEGMEENADKATILGQLAQAQYLLAGSSLTQEVRQTMDEALQINSNEQAIMSILAFESFLADDYTGAISFWRRQISQLTPGSAQVQQLNQRIAAVEQMMGMQQPETDEPVGVSVTVRVAIDDSIRDQIDEDMRVFIFARTEAMPMPLAAVQFNPSDLPLTVTLDESDAMMPQLTLATADTVFIGATIAREATAAEGGFQARSETFAPSEQEQIIELLIADPVP
mgnify:FL=1|tara:strand:- start:961 stop:2205 length:1245 start_codon:yes stop_codon:yes gene_type:complete